MKRRALPALTPAHAAFLRRTVAINKERFSGWQMMADDPTDPPPDPGIEPPADPDKGYPADTPVATMTAEQQAAYWKDKAQMHEGRNKSMLALTGGKYGDDLKALLDERETLLEAQRTDAEKAIEAARKAARDELAAEVGPKSVRTAFDLVLGEMPEDERNAAIEVLNLNAFLTATGDVDTAKVRAHAAKLAPADKEAGNGGQPNYGAGRRDQHPGKSGVAAGAEMFNASRAKSAATK